jgi:hypothetical protein
MSCHECSHYCAVFFFLLLVQGKECPLRPSNDACTNALAITSLPFSTTVDIFGARTVDAGSSASSCYLVDTFQYSKGVWYEVSGDGSCYTVSLRSQSSAVIAVYGGEGGCRELTCVTQNDVSQFGNVSSSFSTQANQTYYIFIGGYEYNAGLVSFEVSVSIRQGLSNGCTG